MGRDASPLRDRVIFVEGAPRSGTTWLVTLLATHPEIAGVDAESHLFDYGVDRLFDNLEHRHPDLHGLQRYVEREQFVDLVRDFCDGALLAMRRRVSAGAEPPFVVEKTPIAPYGDGRDLARKAECYPDAWYVHIVRDREAVIRSLMRAPWMPDRSYEACARLWDGTVGDARAKLGDLPHYRELSYEELRADPAAACAGLFAWLGVDAGEDVLETVRVLSREPFSDLGAVAPAQAGSLRAVLRSVPGRVRAKARAAIGPEPKADVPPGGVVAFRFVEAFRELDRETLLSLTDPTLELIFRSPDGDLSLRGEEGRDALVKLAEDAFATSYVGEWWASAGGAAPFWTSAAGKTTWTTLFSGLRGNATRVDCAIGLILEGDLVRRAVIVSAGPLAGRPVVQAHEPPVSSA